MTNAEKFKEVFGFDMRQSICPFQGVDVEDRCGKCKWLAYADCSKKFWQSEYKGIDREKMFAFLDGAGQGILKGLEIRRGKWIDTEPDKDNWDKSNNPWKCSCCGHRAGKDKYKTYKFCPWCGADMRGDT